MGKVVGVTVGCGDGLVAVAAIGTDVVVVCVGATAATGTKVGVPGTGARCADGAQAATVSSVRAIK